VILIAIDPGPTTCGLVVYDTDAQRVTQAHAELVWPDVRQVLTHHFGRVLTSAGVVCERTQAGPPSGDVVRTTEVVGRVMEACDHLRMPLELVYRREVLATLGVSARGPKDALVRAALIDLHGTSKALAVGTRRAPGPLYGVTSHAWAALALAVTINLRNGAKYAHYCPF
jgi:hypothetical protein